MELAKAHLDIGTMVNDWAEAEHFWAEVVGLPFEKFEKIGGGVRQYRFGAHGSVVKVNHSRTPLPIDPTVHRRVRIAHSGVREPLLVHDSEWVEIELVPPGHEDVVGLEIINATASPAESERFWVVGLGAEVVGEGRYRIGDTLVSCLHVPGMIGPTTRTAAGLRYLTVQVFDVDAEYARLMELGFASEGPPLSLGQTARIAFVRDPDGGYVEVSQRAEITGSRIPTD